MGCFMKNKIILLIFVISVFSFIIGTSFASEADMQLFNGLNSSSSTNELEKRIFNEYETSPMNINSGCGIQNPSDIWNNTSIFKNWIENDNDLFKIFENNFTNNKIENFPKFPIGYLFEGKGSCSDNIDPDFYEFLLNYQNGTNSLSKEAKEKFLDEISNKKNIKIEVSKIEKPENCIITVAKSLVYWKTVKTNENTYKYYKMNTNTIFQNGDNNTTTYIKKQILKTYNKKTNINIKSKNWKKGKYNDGNIIISKDSNKKQINKFKLNKSNKNIKISKVTTTSTKNNKNKKYYTTYKKPSNGKIFKAEKNKKIEEIHVYYTIKKYEWIK